MKKLYTGPLWGNLCNQEILEMSSDSNEVNIYGGYCFFGTEGISLVDWLIENQTRLNLRFHQSRFEEYFLTVSNLIEEKNYNFRRWINPFSGIVSSVESYEVTSRALYENPEDIHKALIPNIEKRNHQSFYQNLEPLLFPEIVIQKIESSIENRNAFKGLAFYNESGSEVANFPFKENFVEKYVKKVMLDLESFQNLSSLNIV